MHRDLSLFKPTGRLTLGNYLGALRPMSANPSEDCFFGIADLHALTVPFDPSRLSLDPPISGVASVTRRVRWQGVRREGRRDACRASATKPGRPDGGAQQAEIGGSRLSTLMRELKTLLVSQLSGATLFVQSDVPAHSQLSYLLECVATTGELGRMIQYKEKGRGVSSTRCSLLTYPVLMAADILLYRPDRVPVGDDQRQHVELTRDLAIRFNSTYGPVFTVPEISTPTTGARVSLADPTSKMGKSNINDEAGIIYLLDPPDVIRRKVARAVTDSDTGPGAVRAGEAKPGVTNLLDILTACGGSADGISTYGALKQAVTDAVVAELEPVQRSYVELSADPAYVDSVFAAGAARCGEVTAPVLAEAMAAMGLA